MSLSTARQHYGCGSDDRRSRMSAISSKGVPSDRAIADNSIPVRYIKFYAEHKLDTSFSYEYNMATVPTWLLLLLCVSIVILFLGKVEGLDFTVPALFSCLCLVAVCSQNEQEATTTCEPPPVSVKRSTIRKVLILFVYWSTYNFFTQERVKSLLVDQPNSCSTRANEPQVILAAQAPKADDFEKCTFNKTKRFGMKVGVVDNQMVGVIASKDITERKFRCTPQKYSRRKKSTNTLRPNSHIEGNSKPQKTSPSEPNDSGHMTSRFLSKCVFHHCIAPWTIAA